MPNKTFVDICFMQMFKQIFLNQITAILELAAIATLTRKTRDGNKPGIIENIDKGFPPCCLL